MSSAGSLPGSKANLALSNTNVNSSVAEKDVNKDKDKDKEEGEKERLIQAEKSETGRVSVHSHVDRQTCVYVYILG